MKKAIAILLLSIQFYNLGGYVALFQYCIYQADKFNELQISKDRYKPTDLVEVKIPVHLPGADNYGGYQQISGSVQLAQNCYNYVQMKMTEDTLYVKCIPNYKTTRLNKANTIFARQVSEAPFNAKKQSSPVKSVTLAKYLPAETTLAATITELTVVLSAKPYNNALKAGHSYIAGQPPEALCS